MKDRITKSLSVSIAIILGFFLLLNVAVVKSSFAKDANVYYTCPMPEHADVVMDKPGKCPKCGMDLVPKKEGKK